MDRVGRPAEGGVQANPDSTHSHEPEAGRELPRRGQKWWRGQAAEKSLSVAAGSRKGPARGLRRPYRTPTLVGRGNTLEVDERSSVKELGKLTP